MRWALPFVVLASLANAQVLSTSIRSGGLSPERFPSAAGDAALLRFLPTVSASDECTGSSLSGTKGQALTFTRASSAYCTKSDGTMVLLTNDQPRLETHGFLIEEARTNLTIRSEEFNSGWTCTNVTVTANSTAAPDGVTDADTLSTAVAGSYCESTAFTITGANAAASLYVRTTSGTQAGAYVLRDTTAGADRCTGSFTASTTWARRTDCTSAAISTGNSHVLRVYPGGVAGTGTIVAWGAMTETPSAGGVSASTSYVATAGTSASRSADIASFGAAYAPTAEFSIAMTARGTNPNNGYLFDTRAGTGATAVLFNGAPHRMYGFASSGSSTPETNVVWSPATDYRVSLVRQGTNLTLSMDATSVTTATTGASGTTTALNLLRNFGSSQFLNGHIRALCVSDQSGVCR